MKIKKYIAKDYQTALKQAKEEMGRDAIILQSRQVKRRGLLSFFYAPQVEITVAADNALQVHTDRMRKSPASTPAPAKTDSLITAQTNTAVASRDDELLSELQNMKGLIEDIKSSMYELEQIGGLPEQLQALYEILVNNHVDREIALNIVSNLSSRLSESGLEGYNQARELCLLALQEYFCEVQPIEVAPDKKGTLVFMVGPTGVGKTTTIAKLAANMAFTEGKDVALVTLDTYRISAAEQLRTFAEIIGIPISVVFDNTDLGTAIEEYKEKDLIFVDTAGRSPNNQEQIEELRGYIDTAHPDETILVLSVTTESSDLLHIYQQFEKVGIDKVIFTKLDETYHYGTILNTIHEIKKPIAYFTTGQNVPDDIEVPDSNKMARLLLRRDGTLS